MQIRVQIFTGFQMLSKKILHENYVNANVVRSFESSDMLFANHVLSANKLFLSA